VRQFIGGLLLGAVMTLVAGALIGPEITLSNVASGNDGLGQGRYDFQIEEKDGVICYALIDTAEGIATVRNEDGTTITVTAPPGMENPPPE